MLGFEISQNPFMLCPSFKAIAHLPFEEKMAILRQPEFREKLLAEEFPDPTISHRTRSWDKIFQLNDPVDYEPGPEMSCAAQAARMGMDPKRLCYDWLLAKGGKAVLYRPLINYADGTLNAVQEMMQHPNTIMGLGDGGAHVSIICDASSHTYMVTHWTRDRTRGQKLPIEWVIRRITRDNALAIGLSDRGLLAPGMKADINVIDHARLRVSAPEVRYDLPAGGRRLVQTTQGYDATIVSGLPVYLDGRPTGALPGRLVRGTR
jgi:N-acyl-D-aspartate/D-glutamate deacylase